MLERKRHLQLYCPTTTWRTSSLDNEFGLFYKCMTNKSWQLKSEKCSGRKFRKVRKTGLAAANALGDKIPMFVIGKTKKLHWFKNAKFLSCRYQHKKKVGWMGGVLQEEWVWELDQKFSSEGRSVALVIDNSPAHPHIENLKSIKLFFWPLNTTSTTQPMDQSIITLLRTKCCKNMVQKIIRSLEKNNALPEVSFFQQQRNEKKQLAPY